MRLWWRSILVTLAALLALACTSPTLPLPPPAAPTETDGTDPNTFVLSGKGAIPGATLIVWNPNAPTGANQINGTIVSAGGTWTVTIAATKGDIVQIWEESGGEESSAIDFTIQ